MATMGPRPRLGPRPLALHLGTAAASATIWLGAWRLWKDGSMPLSPGSPGNPGGPALRAAAGKLRKSLEKAEAEAFDAALEGEIRRRFDAFLAGLEGYRADPYVRDLDDPEAVWSQGTTRLLDYGGVDARARAGRPVLVVPSLVNRAYVLDLAAGASLMRHLAAHGHRPLLVDWGAPGAAERGFTLTDYIAGRLDAAADAALDLAGAKMPVIGYCMGGLLALALALRRPDAVSGLALLATPWDFHADSGGPPPALAALRAPLSSMLDGLGVMPLDVLQAFFFGLDPMLSWRKFRRFAALDPASEAARLFVALEDWANDGVALAGPTARECLFGWYLDNTPAGDAWRVAGRPVIPGALRCPALVAMPTRDRIVPPASAAALADAIPGAQRLEIAAGHIGMVVGGRAPKQLWRPLEGWLSSLARAGE